MSRRETQGKRGKKRRTMSARETDVLLARMRRNLRRIEDENRAIRATQSPYDRLEGVSR